MLMARPRNSMCMPVLFSYCTHGYDNRICTQSQKSIYDFLFSTPLNAPMHMPDDAQSTFWHRSQCRAYVVSTQLPRQYRILAHWILELTIVTQNTIFTNACGNRKHIYFFCYIFPTLALPTNVVFQFWSIYFEKI